MKWKGELEMFKDIFNFEDWDQLDTNIFIYYDVDFKQDFGLFKRGSSYKTMTIDYDEGTITIYKDNDEIDIVQKFIPVASGE